MIEFFVIFSWQISLLMAYDTLIASRSYLWIYGNMIEFRLWQNEPVGHLYPLGSHAATTSTLSCPETQL